MQNYPEDIQQAINDIYAWVQQGCPEHDVFDTCYGLCHNIIESTDWNYSSEEIQSLLFNGEEYPFNIDWKDYSNELHYSNPKRIAWLKANATA